MAAPQSSPLSSLGAVTPTLSSSCSPSLASSSDLSSAPSSPSRPSSVPFRDRIEHRYLSPSSTTPSSEMESPVKLCQPLDDILRPQRSTPSSDAPPPAKKRKTMASRERTTEYIDLTKDEDDLTKEDEHRRDRLIKMLRKKKKIVVIAGAGISVSAGIPDFRSSTGLFATVKSQHKLKASGKQLFDASVYRHSSSTESFHTMVRNMDSMSKEASPTPFHHLLASLAQEGRLLRLYSQNIDCLDTSMTPLATQVPLNGKGPWPTTVQLHGSLEKMVCTKCGHIAPFKSELFDGPEAPLCQTCMETDQVRTTHAGKRSHGIGRLRPRFVLYNEYNPDEEAIGNVSSADLKTRPDAVIVVGTTLKVPGTRRLVKELCQVTRGRRDGLTAWINTDPAPKGIDFKDCWDLVVRSECDDVARLVALPSWDFHIGNDYQISKEQDAKNRERQSRSILEIGIPSGTPDSVDEQSLSTPKSKKMQEIQGILTPQPSPKITATKHNSKTKQAKLPFSVSKENIDTKSKIGKKAKSSKPRGPKQKQQSGELTFKLTKKAGLDEKRKLKKDQPVPMQLQNPSAQLYESAPNSRLMAKKTKNGLQPAATQSDTPMSSTSSPNRDTISPKSVPKRMTELIEMGKD